MANRTMDNPHRVLIDSDDGTRARFCLIGDHLGVEIMQDRAKGYTFRDLKVALEMDPSDTRGLPKTK